jgi:hypothetical protein
LGTQVIWPDLRNVNVLCGIDQETPPKDVKPDEKDWTEPGLGFLMRMRWRSLPAALRAAELFVPRKEAVSAASKTNETTHPVAPMRRKVRRPNLST